MGNGFMQQKMYEKAVEAYKNALRNNPTDDETRYNYALAKELLEKEKQEQEENQDQQDQTIKPINRISKTITLTKKEIKKKSLLRMEKRETKKRTRTIRKIKTRTKRKIKTKIKKTLKSLKMIKARIKIKRSPHHLDLVKYLLNKSRVFLKQ